MFKKMQYMIEGYLKATKADLQLQIELKRYITNLVMLNPNAIWEVFGRSTTSSMDHSRTITVGL
jgi:hypothetical protein